MAKRPRRDGGRFPGNVLRRRISTCDIAESADANDLAHYLRSFYPDYRRLQFRPFALNVRKALEDMRRLPQQPQPTTESDDGSNGDEDSVRGGAGTCLASTGCSRRAPERHVAGERLLLHVESEHRCRRVLREQVQSSDLATPLSDSVLEPTVEPYFGLTKSMLRDSYGRIRKRAGKKERAVDMEIEKPLKVQAVVDGGSGIETPTSIENVCSSGGGIEMVAYGREPGPRFCDLGGMEGVLEKLMIEVIVPLCHPEVPRGLGVRPITGILLHGPPGCGKTMLAHAIANETGVPFYKISATEVVSGVSGASEEMIRDLFEKAYRTAPSIVFIDEIDAIASKRDNMQREMERRIVTQLMTCMDGSNYSPRSDDTKSVPEASERKPAYVLVIGATNRPDELDRALRRPGRFDSEIVLQVPNENARLGILSVLARDLKLEGQFDPLKIAKSTPGFVAADLAAVVNKAGNLAMKRVIDRRRSQLSGGYKEKNYDWWKQPWAKEEIDSLCIMMTDFEEAVKMVQPSMMREGFSSIPNVTWENVGGLAELRKELVRYIVQPAKYSEFYEQAGVNLQAGFLLYGPPGCGKTLIAKALANEAKANFIHIKGPELLSKYVGDSEGAVRKIFDLAQKCSPCILFFDEVDSLTSKRGTEGGWVVERTLNQLLISLDGGDKRERVYVIGATNRLDVMDPAVLRQGRLGNVRFVGLPSADDRKLILKAHAQKKQISDDLLDKVACSKKCRNFTGADVAALMNEAAMVAVEERIQNFTEQGILNANALEIRKLHFKQAYQKIKPSLTKRDIKYYEETFKRFRSG